MFALGCEVRVGVIPEPWPLYVQSSNFWIGIFFVFTESVVQEIALQTRQWQETQCGRPWPWFQNKGAARPWLRQQCECVCFSDRRHHASVMCENRGSKCDNLFHPLLKKHCGRPAHYIGHCLTVTKVLDAKDILLQISRHDMHKLSMLKSAAMINVAAMQFLCMPSLNNKERWLMTQFS